jgi:hypothetical protein
MDDTKTITQKRFVEILIKTSESGLITFGELKKILVCLKIVVGKIILHTGQLFWP